MAKDTRKFYVTLDNTIGTGRTSGNIKIMNNIVNTLKAAGLDAQEAPGGGIGPNRWTRVIRNNKLKSNIVVVGFVNGIDAGVVEEATNNYGYNRNSAKKIANKKGEPLRGGKDNEFHGPSGFLHQKNINGEGTDRNNDLCLCFFYNCKDFYNETGEYYKWLVRAHDDNYSHGGFKGTSYPRKWLEDYDIKIVYNKGDYDGISTARKAAALFTEGSTPEPTPTPDDTTTTPDSSTTKTLSKKIVKNTFKAPYYEKILTTKTEGNGAFIIKQPSDMNIKGEYLVNLYFAGDSTHSSSNKSIRIHKFSGVVAKEELLETITTEYYTDGSSQETGRVGKVPDDQTIKTKTITITYTYENGVLKNTDIKTVENYKIIEKAQEVENIGNATPTDTEVNNNTPTSTGTADPFSNDVALLSSGEPNVAAMSTGGKKYVMYDENKSYKLSQAQFREVYDRDSKSLQLNNYKVSKYTAFQSTDTQTYNVIPRMRWNPVAQAVHRWLAAHDGASWFNEITINFGSLNCVIDGTTVPFTGKEREYHVVVDHQDDISTTTGTCGPTSCSMATAWLYKYVSENKMRKPTGHGWHGIAPVGATKGLNSLGFSARRVGGKQNWMNGLREGKPVVFFEGDHYICLYDIDGDRILAANPGGSYSGFGSGWQSSATVDREGRGNHNIVSLAWTISEDEKQKINHFYKSMGGAWSRPSNTRLLPIIWNGSIRDRS